jgi:hypothetical protein
MEQLADKPRFESRPERLPWQYSLRGLLILTAIVSIALTVGIYFAGALFVLGVIALVQGATLLAGDWLIRPQNRRALATATAGSWMILGSGLALIGGCQLYVLLRDDGSAAAWAFALCLAAAGLYCVYVAANRWRRLTRTQSSNA